MKNIQFGRAFSSLLCWLPRKIFNKLYILNYNSKLQDLFNSALIKRVLYGRELNADYKKTIDKIKSNKKYALIKYSDWNYRYFNFCYLTNVLGMIVFCLYNGYIPIVGNLKIKGSDFDAKNIWEQFFVQPFCFDIDKTGEKLKIFDIAISPINPDFKSILDDKYVDFWGRIYNDFVIANEEIKKYFEDEYNSILKGKKVLGCICRGTDYTSTKPKGHPIQPSIKDVIIKCKEFINEEKLDYIYLATEEKKTVDLFEKEFPGKILVNKRVYYDIYNSSDSSFNVIGQVKHNRENDDFLRGLEYLSSINLLSKCDCLVGGWCGGTGGAVYMNGNKYNKKYIFDLGKY